MGFGVWGLGFGVEDLHELKALGWMIVAHHSDGWASTFFWLVAAFNGLMAILYMIRGAKK